MNGQPLHGGLHRLNYRLKQSLLLQVPTDDFLRGIVVLDEKDRVHVFPDEAASVAASVGSTTYIFTVDKVSGHLAGYSLAYSKGKNLVAHKVSGTFYLISIINYFLKIYIFRSGTWFYLQKTKK